MIKKSLLTASLLLVGASAMASNYVAVDYLKGSSTLKNSVGTVDFDAYAISLGKNTAQYMVRGTIAKVNADSSDLYYGGTDTYSLSNDFTLFEVQGAYKILNKNNIFVAPYLQYSSYNNSTVSYTNNRTGQTYSSDTESDNNLGTGIILGYNLNNDVDNYIYIDYDIDDDLLESEDHDDHTLEVGVSYKIAEKIIFNCAYGKDMSNDEDTESNSYMTIGLGYTF